MRALYFAWPTALAILAAQDAFAQADARDGEGGLLYIGSKEKVVPKAVGQGQGNGADPTGQKVPDADHAGLVSISTSTDTKNATLSATFNLPPFTTEGDIFGNRNSRQAYITASAQSPLGQGADYTNLATLDGLTKSTAVDFKLFYVSADLKRQTSFADKSYQTACRKIMLSGLSLAQTGLKADEIKRYKMHACDTDFIDEIESHVESSLKAKQAELNAAAATPNFDEEKLEQIEKEVQYRETILESFRSAPDALNSMKSYNLESLWMLAAHGKVGYETHKFIHADTLKGDSISETTLDFGAGITRVFKDGTSSLNLSFDFQRSFDDGVGGKSETRCDDNDSGGLDCATGFFGLPTRKNKALLAVDYRRIGSIWGVPYGIDPGFTYDTKAKTEGFQFPVYLFTDKDHNLSGGIRYDWTSEKNESVVGVFATAAFSVLPLSPQQ